MKKVILFFTALCLVINFYSCTPEVIPSDTIETYQTGGEIDDPVDDPDEDDK